MADALEDSEPFDCDGHALALLARVLLLASQLDYALWRIGRKAGDPRLPATYIAPPVVMEARDFMRRFDLGALEAGLEAIARQEEAARAN